MWNLISGLFQKWDAKTTIAVLALIQPWLYWLYKRFWRPGSIDVHHTGSVEIGFSGYGATIGLQGVLRAVDRDFFISSMSIELTREADQSHHVLEWGAFRPPVVLAGSPKEPIEMASGLMLQQSSPQRYNILFMDTTAQRQVRDVVAPVQRAWSNALEANNVSQDTQNTFYMDKFKNERVHVDAWADLDRVIYWHPGWYRMQLRIDTTRPNRQFSTVWRMELSEQEVTNLRLNRIPMLKSLANFDDPYFFAYVAYH